MNKNELVGAIADKAGLTKKAAASALDAMLDVVMDAVAQNQKVTLVGFGTFEPRYRKAREGRNPKTGESIMISDSTLPAFSAGKEFKERVSG